MGKAMGKLNDNNTVIELLWYSDAEKETEKLKNIGDRIVSIGDSYIDGEWFHKGKKVYTNLEISQLENQKLRDQIQQMETEQKASYREGVNSI